jgi:hypothetical protein
MSSSVERDAYRTHPASGTPERYTPENCTPSNTSEGERTLE